MPTGWGDASNWKDEAINDGYTVDNTPAVGSVAWWSSNHVAWVKTVSGGNITIEEYNYGFPLTGEYNTRTIAATNPTKYIHFQDTDAPSAYVEAPSMYTASNGDIWIAGVTDLGVLFTRKFDSSAGTWNTKVSHNTGWSPNSSPAIIMDTSDNVWLAAVKTNGNLYAKYLSGSWQAAVLVDSNVSINAGVDMTQRSNGNVSLAYVRQDEYMKYANGNTSGWTVGGAQFSSGWSTSSTPAIAERTTGSLIMSGVRTNGHLYLWTVGNPSVKHLDDYAGFSTDGGVDLVARSNGHMTLVAIDDGGDFWHRTFNMTTNNTSSGAIHGIGNWSLNHRPSVALDSDDHLWIAAIKSNGDAYAYESTSSWSSALSLGSSFEENAGLSLAPRSAGSVSVASASDSSVVQHQTWNGSTWSSPFTHF
jgi:hypothetical protein